MAAGSHHYEIPINGGRETERLARRVTSTSASNNPVEFCLNSDASIARGMLLASEQDQPKIAITLPCTFLADRIATDGVTVAVTDCIVGLTFLSMAAPLAERSH